jgi:hypothetical protein
MISRYLKTAGLVIPALACYGVSLLPLILVWPHLDTRPLIGAMAVWSILAVISLPFVLRLIIRKVWFFRGRGEPVSLNLLVSMLVGINELDCPVIARKKRNKIIFSWRSSEPAWCERMALEGRRKTYELRLRFDSDTRTVTMIDRVRRLDLDLCPVKVRTGLLSFPRLYCRISTGLHKGLESFKNRPPEEFRFQPRELKESVFNTIVANGWNVRFDLF